MTAFPPSIEVTRLYEKVSQRSTRYFVGRLGLARIMPLSGDPAEDGTPTWQSLLQAAPNSKASADRSASCSLRRSPRASRQSVGGGPTGRPMPDDSVADLWADVLNASGS
jgi:hypothetical protein